MPLLLGAGAEDLFPPPPEGLLTLPPLLLGDDCLPWDIPLGCSFLLWFLPTLAELLFLEGLASAGRILLRSDERGVLTVAELRLPDETDPSSATAVFPVFREIPLPLRLSVEPPARFRAVPAPREVPATSVRPPLDARVPLDAIPRLGSVPPRRKTFPAIAPVLEGVERRVRSRLLITLPLPLPSLRASPSLCERDLYPSQLCPPPCHPCPP